jgi:hypothetical protein
MSKNINQIYVASPATSMQPTDLLYLGRSPYGVTDDRAILFSNFQSSVNGLTWSTIAGTTQAAAVNNGYIIGNVAQTTVTLPATAAIGQRVAVEGYGAGGFIVQANAGQTIIAGAYTTSVAGSLTWYNNTDNCYLICVVANTVWKVQTTYSSGMLVA